MRKSLMCPSWGADNEGGDAISDLEEAVLKLLEEAGLPTDINDRIMRLVQLGERRAAGEPDGGASLSHALAALAPYADPDSDPDKGRADAQRIIMRELGLKASAGASA